MIKEVEGGRSSYPSMDIKHYESRNEKRFFYVDFVKELWDEVSKYSAKKHYDWRIYDLNAKGIQARQGSENILLYSSKLKGIWREIDYLWQSQNPQSVEMTYICKQRLFTFLMGPNAEYENVRSQILHLEKVPDLEEAIGIILEEESRLKLMPEAPPNQPTAFIAKKYDSKPAQGDAWVGRKGSLQPTGTKPGDESRTTYGALTAERKDTLKTLAGN